jgi:hypothetical protein
VCKRERERERGEGALKSGEQCKSVRHSFYSYC